jgi:hypothetical protein
MFCYACSANYRPLPQLGLSFPVRHCDTCFRSAPPSALAGPAASRVFPTPASAFDGAPAAAAPSGERVRLRFRGRWVEAEDANLRLECLLAAFPELPLTAVPPVLRRLPVLPSRRSPFPSLHSR